LYFIYYGLPTIGIKLPPFMSGVVTLGFNYAAFEAENYRAGIVAIHSGQMEAARALGMSQWQGLRYVVIPQAFRVMLPPVTNDFIALLKDSALVSVVSIVDLTHAYNLIATNHFNYFQLGIIVAIIYLILGLPFIQLTRWAERRLAVEKKRNY
jgi:polar amino acid transport system substrate-binding protein